MEKDNDPRGKVYKLASERPKKEITLVILQKMNANYTETLEEILEVMLHAFLPDGNM